MTQHKTQPWVEPNWLANRPNANQADVDVDAEYQVLFKIRNWRITTGIQIKIPITNLDGPSMWHRGCKGFTHVLSRSNPKCVKCGVKIPERIQTVYTLLNWQHGHNEEYFDE